VKRQRYQYPEVFPSEAFVQAAIEDHFEEYVCGVRAHVDFVCTHADPAINECWVIEVKGQTQNTGLDVRSGLGQILMAMQPDGAHYALALPATPAVYALCSRVAPHIRQALQLFWLFVDSTGAVTVVAPGEPLPAFPLQMAGMRGRYHGGAEGWPGW